jgi:hypothetical protein
MFAALMAVLLVVFLISTCAPARADYFGLGIGGGTLQPGDPRGWQSRGGYSTRGADYPAPKARPAKRKTKR